MERYGGLICPTIQEILETKKFSCSNCFPEYSVVLEYEVDHDNKRYIVDLRRHTCGCKEWDLTGIPCIHFCKSRASEKLCSSILQQGSILTSIFENYKGSS